MRRIIGLAAIRRVVDRVAVAAPSVAGNPVRHRRLVQAALFTTAATTTTNSSLARSRWFSCSKTTADRSTRAAAHAAAGVILFSVAATAVGEEAHAKQHVQSEFRLKDVVLHQYEACPFCNKVKAFLDYNDIPYKVVEVNPICKKEIKWSDYKKVHRLMVDGEQMADSSDTIDKLAKKIHSNGTIDSVADSEEKKWCGWVDNHFVHILLPNIYRNTSEALESFDYITSHGNFNFAERITAKYAGAAAMYFVSKNLKKKYNITDERAALYEAAETWVDALDGRDFLDMVDQTRIGDWYARMEAAAGPSSIIQA